MAPSNRRRSPRPFRIKNVSPAGTTHRPQKPGEHEASNKKARLHRPAHIRHTAGLANGGQKTSDRDSRTAEKASSPPITTHSHNYAD